ncbi:MAG: pyridoxal phosphate-dependent decarboxylase family protein [Rhodomicrobium sp.]
MSVSTDAAGGRPAAPCDAEWLVPSEALYPPAQERRRIDDLLTEELLVAAARMERGPTVPDFDREKFQAGLETFDFASPKRLEDVLGWTIEQMLHGIVHVNHPRYFGLFNPAPAFPSQCADRIAAAFNPQLASAVTSPAAVAIEAHTIAAVAKRAGLPPETAGHFTSGGSDANYTAVICALTQSCAGYAEAGVRAFSGAPVFYASRESHLAWVKIAHQAGIGRAAVRLIATGGDGRMDAGALAAAIRANRAAGQVPFMIAATAGTTNAGAIDPLTECAAVARAEGLWYHIDAAWGGAAIASARLRPLLAGIEHADSVTIDAHKWFAATMGCGMFLTPKPAILPAAFHVSASYMPPRGAMPDPYVNSAQWSRRFSGLRLFLSLAAGGWDAYARHVEKSAGLAAYLAARLERCGWTVVNDPSLAVLCALPPAGKKDVRSIVNSVLASGRAWVSAANFEGREVLRACVTHGETTQEDAGELVCALEAALA